MMSEPGKYPLFCLFKNNKMATKYKRTLHCIQFMFVKYQIYSKFADAVPEPEPTVNASDSEWRFSHIISGNCGSNLLLVKINEH